MTVEEMKQKLMSDRSRAHKDKAWGGYKLGKVVYRDSDEWIINKTDKSKLHQKPYYLRNKDGKSQDN